MEQNYKNYIKNKLNCMYAIITDKPNENTKSYIAYNNLISDEDGPGPIVPNQSIDTTNNNTEWNNEVIGNEHDLLDAENEIKWTHQHVVWLILMISENMILHILQFDLRYNEYIYIIYRLWSVRISHLKSRILCMYNQYES